MNIKQYKIKLSAFTAELPDPLDRDCRCLVTTEVDIHDVSHPTNGDGTFDEVYKAKVVGTTIVRQGEEKAPVLAKSKRSRSVQLRSSLWRLDASEDYYDKVMAAIISNTEEVVEHLMKEGKLYI